MIYNISTYYFYSKHNRQTMGYNIYNIFMLYVFKKHAQKRDPFTAFKVEHH